VGYSVVNLVCGPVGSPPYMAPELFLSYLGSGGAHSTGGYDSKCDVWSIGCILWDMANSAEKFVNQLVSNVGYNVAQAGTDSMGAKEIQELIEHDIPQVSGHAMACTLSPNHFCWSTSILLVFSSWILQSFYSFHIALYCKNFIRLLLPALTLYIRG